MYYDKAETACKPCDAGDFCPAGASLKLAPTCNPGTYANMSAVDGEPECGKLRERWRGETQL